MPEEARSLGPGGDKVDPRKGLFREVSRKGSGRRKAAKTWLDRMVDLGIINFHPKVIWRGLKFPTYTGDEKLVLEHDSSSESGMLDRP